MMKEKFELKYAKESEQTEETWKKFHERFLEEKLQSIMDKYKAQKDWATFWLNWQSVLAPYFPTATTLPAK